MKAAAALLRGYGDDPGHPDRTEPASAQTDLAEAQESDSAATERYVVIGGGAGGLELVVKLARRLRHADDTEVVLIDKNPTHIWKPLFHEVATGSINSSHDETSYRMLARKHGFRFVLGSVTSVDTAERRIRTAPRIDQNGREQLPGQSLHYHTLAVCVGSESNDFGIEGVREHARLLDSREQAERFHQHFSTQLQRVNLSADRTSRLSVVIVGGGATGVELAADMHNVVDRLHEYGLEHVARDRLSVCIVEAAAELLPRLPARVGASVKRELELLGVRVCTDTTVSAVSATSVQTSDGSTIPADISVWAAGVKAPRWLAECGFPVDRLGRVEIERDLTVKGLPNVYALGDCAAGRTDGGSEIPPRAQAAHQMASVAATNILRRRRGRPPKAFRYRDFGSLISLSKYSTIGNLMGNLMRGSVFIEGWIARLVYLSLYRMHQAAVHGRFATLLLIVGDRIYKATRAEVKLH